MDCNKYKNKAILGAVIFILFNGIGRYIDRLYFMKNEFIFIVLTFLILGFTWYLVFPYIICLNEERKKWKP